MRPPNHKTANKQRNCLLSGEKPLFWQSSTREIIEKEKLLCKFISNAMLSSTVSLKIQ